MTFQKYKTHILPAAFALYFLGTFISMALMSITAGILALALCILFFDTQSTQTVKKIWQSKLVRFYGLITLLLFIACFLSLLSAQINPLIINGFTPNVSYIKDLAKTWYFFWPLLMCFGLFQIKQEAIEFLQKYWIFLLCIFGLLAIYQYFTGWPRMQHLVSPGQTRYHATLGIGHHLSVASIFIFPFFFSLDYFFYKKRTLLKSLLYLLPCSLGFILLFLTYSRMLWISIPVGLFIWLLLRLKLKNIFIVSGILIGLFSLAYFNPTIYSNLNHRRGIPERVELWNANLEFFKNRPIFGVGLRKNGELSGPYLTQKLNTDRVFAGHAHNNFLEILASTGLLGASIWLLWCLYPFGVLLWLKIKGHPLSSGLFAAWIVFHLNGLTQVNFWDAKVLHQMSIFLLWMLFFVVTFQKEPTKNARLT